MLDKNKPTMTTARSMSNTSYLSPGKISQACSNFYKSDHLVDSSTPNVVNVMMTNATNTEEQLTAMMQIMEALKKYVEDKDLSNSPTDEQVETLQL
ncbi:hypothetical protein RND71_002262 [Anisodus tanguticus]|uniref:Uncharacterized protein n=1 Tax=Anisodus tanguticus TaxID=243964 RepID=A0AAE1T1L2_9SOLA|nr:hypothetical protein RND71_002262 [Anisodus tanguticus]